VKKGDSWITNQGRCATCSRPPAGSIAHGTKRLTMGYHLTDCVNASLNRKRPCFSFDFPLNFLSIRQARICPIHWHNPTSKPHYFLWFCVVFCWFTKTAKSTRDADILKHVFVCFRGVTHRPVYHFPQFPQVPPAFCLR